MAAGHCVYTNTSVAFARHRTTSIGRTRPSPADAVLSAGSSKAMLRGRLLTHRALFASLHLLTVAAGGRSAAARRVPTIEAWSAAGGVLTPTPPPRSQANVMAAAPRVAAIAPTTCHRVKPAAANGLGRTDISAAGSVRSPGVTSGGAADPTARGSSQTAHIAPVP